MRTLEAQRAEMERRNRVMAAQVDGARFKVERSLTGSWDVVNVTTGEVLAEMATERAAQVRLLTWERVAAALARRGLLCADCGAAGEKPGHMGCPFPGGTR